jgi:hypothetical protein
MAKAKRPVKQRRVKPIIDVFASMRPSREELADLARVEKSGKAADFARKLAALDRKYQSPPAPKGLKKEVFAEDDSPRISLTDLPRPPGLGALLDMTGPEFNTVQRGMIGANREGSGEYRVRNPGDTGGKTRVPMFGRVHIRFGASLPVGGRWCVLHPAGPLLISGQSRVIGHGNMTTSFDAKVSVNYVRMLQTETELVSLFLEEIHFDATRSEDRGKNFNDDRDLRSRYRFFETDGPTDVWLMHALDVHTEANVDGFASVSIDLFGFLANGSSDFNTFVFKAG